MWPWLARMEIEVGHTRLSCHREVPLLNLNFIGIAVYNLQRAAAGKWLQHCLQWAWHHWGRGWELCRRKRGGESLGSHHRSMERCKWKVSFLMDNGMEQWCLVIDVFMKCEYCKLKASLLMARWTEQFLMCVMWSWNGNIANPKLIWWPAELSLMQLSLMQALKETIATQRWFKWLQVFKILGTWCDHCTMQLSPCKGVN